MQKIAAAVPESLAALLGLDKLYEQQCSQPEDFAAAVQLV